MKIWLSSVLSVVAIGIMATEGQNAFAGATAQASATSAVSNTPTDLTANTREVIKLQQSGIGTNVINSFIANSSMKFQLSAEDVIYLHSLDVPEGLIVAMIRHDQQFDATAPSVATATAVAPAVPPPAPVVVQQPAPVVVAPPPAPVYVAPTYVYPYYPYGYPVYYPAVRVGVGVGVCGIGVGVGVGL